MRPTTVADLRRMLDDVPDHYEIVVDLDPNVREIQGWMTDAHRDEDDDGPLLLVEAVETVGFSGVAYVAIRGTVE